MSKTNFELDQRKINSDHSIKTAENAETQKLGKGPVFPRPSAFSAVIKV
jgi:hypothetical protein